MTPPRPGRAAQAWLMREARGQRRHLALPILLGLAATLCALAQAC
jgi:hypothetical protein